jgi:GNAT superfamily N-acetyltransferase
VFEGSSAGSGGGVAACEAAGHGVDGGPADHGFGNAEWFERGIAETQDDDTLWLVATTDGPGGRVVGMIEAVIQRPHPDGRWQLQRDQSRTRLLINALAVSEDYRRQGVGTLLMDAAEDWGRSKERQRLGRPSASRISVMHRTIRSSISSLG